MSFFIYSKSINPEHHIYINSLGENGTLLSAGPGIEREVIFTAFESYRREYSQWFETRENGMASVKIVYPISASRFIPQQRLLSLTKLGALCALLLIIGQCPSPLDPCILQYAVHGTDIHSLHPAFVGEWHPETRAKVLQWLDIGSDGDIAPFQNHLAAYNALEVSLSIAFNPLYSNSTGCYRYHRSRIGMREHTRLLLLICYIA